MPLLASRRWRCGGGIEEDGHSAQQASHIFSSLVVTTKFHIRLMKYLYTFCFFCSVVLEESESFGHTKDRTTLFDDSLVEISLENLLRRLQHLPSMVFDPPTDDE